MQPGLLNGAKLGGVQWVEEFVTVPLGATLMPFDAVGFQSDTEGDNSSFICAVFPLRHGYNEEMMQWFLSLMTQFTNDVMMRCFDDICQW